MLLVELRQRSQITIPAEIVKRLNLHEGDQFEVIEKDGGIFLCPVVVYPREKMQEIAKIFKEAKEDETLKEYDSVEEMFKDMGIDLDEIWAEAHKGIPEEPQTAN